MKNDTLEHVWFRRSFLGSYFRIMSNPSQKAICSSRNKSQMAPNEKVLFHEKLGLRSNTWGTIPFLIVKVQFLKKLWKKEDQCTSIFHFADRPEVPYEVDFWRNSFSKQKPVSENSTFFECDFGCFLRDFWKCVRILAWSKDGKCCQALN